MYPVVNIYVYPQGCAWVLNQVFAPFTVEWVCGPLKTPAHDRSWCRFQEGATPSKKDMFLVFTDEINKIIKHDK